MPEYFYDVEQRSVQWLNLRLGIPTTSSFKQIMDSDFVLRTGQMPRTYCFEKVAERISGQIAPTYQSPYMEQGSIKEDEATAMFQIEQERQIKLCGFVLADDKRSGCSPDGLIGEDGGTEIKCPEPETHIRYLYENRLPLDYAAQVHGSLFVTGRPWWMFMSYCRKLPPFYLLVKRDEDIIQRIGTALKGFQKLYDDVLNKLTS